MKTKLTALLLALCLILGCTSAMADTAQARLNQKIATRTGPGTNYTEPGTFLSQGNYVTVHTRVWDSRNEIWWVQVDFTSGGYRYRAYTGSWRMSVDLSRVPQERSLGTVRVTANTCVYAGPGWDYKMWDNTVKSGTTEAIKADTEALQQSFYKISEKLYQQQAAQGGAPGADAGAYGTGTDANGGTYYNADYEDKTGNN